MIGGDLPLWAGDYRGIAFAEGGRDRAGGVDCYGLLRLIYAEQFGITLPSLTGAYERLDQRDVLAVVASVERETNWRSVAAPAVGDCVLLRVTGRPIHVGVCLSATKFLHTMAGPGVVIEALRGLRWRSRIEGFYRYEPAGGTAHIRATEPDRPAAGVDRCPDGRGCAA